VVLVVGRKLDYQLGYGSPAVFPDARFVRIADTHEAAALLGVEVDRAERVEEADQLGPRLLGPAPAHPAMTEADVVLVVGRKLDYQLGYGSPAVFPDARFVRRGAGRARDVARPQALRPVRIEGGRPVAGGLDDRRQRQF
jgi:hypothetical protein